MKDMKVIYLAAGRAKLNYSNVDYNDIKENCNVPGDMFNVDLSKYDILIATPPCNYYSRANYKRETSIYAQQTKNMLPEIIDKFINTGKYFIIENVRNEPLFKKLGLYDKPCLIYKHGRHTYWTNIMLDIRHIKQEYDFKNIPGYGTIRLKSYVQGGRNVNDVFDYFIQIIIGRQ